MLMSTPPKGQEDQYTLEKYLKSRNIGWMELLLDDNDVEEMWFNETEKSLYEIKPNDIVMNEGGDIGKAALWREQPYKCYIQNSVNKLTADSNLSPLFLQYLLFAIAQTNYFWSVVNPVSIAHLTKEKLSETPIIIPPLAEQEVIAAYLDLKVGQIDAILSEKEAMVEQLQQYRKSLISETVTRGLNPNVPMKDSGIDWIGKIPQHWDVKKIGFIFDNLDYLRQPVASENRERKNPQYDYYGASGVIDKIDYYNVDDKVLLIGEDGANLVARNLPLVYKAEGKFWVNNHAHILKPKDDDYDFMAHALEAADYTLYITGSAQPKLSQDNLQSVKLPVPPIEEQKRIAVFLNETALKIDSSISELQSQIEDLKAYKSSVITEAVTGKVDLRDWKPSEENA